MDYKNLLLRIPIVFLFFFIFILIISQYEVYIQLIVYAIYLIIFIEIIYFFRKNLYIFIISLIYLLISVICFKLYYNNFYIKNEFIFTILIVIIFDIFSYIFGSKFGKLKILPVISPNKTYFGFIAGFIISFIFGYFLNYYYNIFNICLSIFYIIATLLIAFIGDIIESFLKRKSNIKNSSKILLGHGGFFDRFDSLIMVVMWLFIFNLLT